MTELLFLQWRNLTRAEKICLLVLAVTLVAWLFMPAIAQPPAYNAFADTRMWLGVPNAADVLSNLAFLAVGVYGIVALRSPRRERMSRATEASLWCAALGFVATSAGSAWFHLQPSDATLVFDRLGMALIFTGLIGTALARRVGDNVARAGLAVVFDLGIASIAWWRVTGDLSLWIVVQAGGMVALLLLLALARSRDDPFPWGWLLAWYAIAKLAEFADQAIWSATSGLFAGHVLKHLLAAIGGYVFFRGLTQRRGAPAAQPPPAPRVVSR